MTSHIPDIPDIPSGAKTVVILLISLYSYCGQTDTHTQRQEHVNFVIKDCGGLFDIIWQYIGFIQSRSFLRTTLINQRRLCHGNLRNLHWHCSSYPVIKDHFHLYLSMIMLIIYSTKMTTVNNLSASDRCPLYRGSLILA